MEHIHLMSTLPEENHTDLPTLGIACLGLFCGGACAGGGCVGGATGLACGWMC